MVLMTGTYREWLKKHLTEFSKSYLPKKRIISSNYGNIFQNHNVLIVTGEAAMK